MSTTPAHPVGIGIVGSGFMRRTYVRGIVQLVPEARAVAIFGGRGRLHGVLAGVVLIGVLSSALRLESVTVNVTNIIVGLLLVASVILPNVLAWTSSRLPRKATPAAPRESHTPENAASAGVTRRGSDS